MSAETCSPSRTSRRNMPFIHDSVLRVFTSDFTSRKPKNRATDTSAELSDSIGQLYRGAGGASGKPKRVLRFLSSSILGPPFPSVCVSKRTRLYKMAFAGGRAGTHETSARSAAAATVHARRQSSRLQRGGPGRADGSHHLPLHLQRRMHQGAERDQPLR